MGFSFRKRIKILPGVHLNLGKRGVSMSAGVKGFSITRGHGRTGVSVGIPGTGISHRSSFADQAKAVTEAAPEPIPPRTAYRVGQHIGEVGVIAWLCGWAARLAAALFGLVGFFGTISSAAQGRDGLAGRIILIAVCAGLTWGLWRLSTKLLRR